MSVSDAPFGMISPKCPLLGIHGKASMYYSNTNNHSRQTFTYPRIEHSPAAWIQPLARQSYWPITKRLMLDCRAHFPRDAHHWALCYHQSIACHRNPAPGQNNATPISRRDDTLARLPSNLGLSPGRIVLLSPVPGSVSTHLHPTSAQHAHHATIIRTCTNMAAQVIQDSRLG